ncbi:MAG: ABC transporter ATP-binding protein, partial [Candidatus Kariarchaeaceae archaeon]
FLGENGAGKSTTLQILSGLVYPSTGKYEILGLEGDKNRQRIAQKIRVLIESPGFIPYLTGKQILTQMLRLKGGQSKDEIDELMATVKLTNAYDKKVKTYSTGMKQRLGLATALIGNPELILLDEPFSGLDVKGVIEIKSLLADYNKKHATTVFLSSHRLREIDKLCSDVMVIRNGSVVSQGKIEELIPERNIINIEVSDAKKASLALSKHSINHDITDGTWIRVRLDSIKRKELVDLLNTSGISIYYLSSENNLSLEDYYLSQTREIIVS